MNCRPGDLAMIHGLSYALDEANGRIVKLRNAAPFYDLGMPHWALEEVQSIILRQDGVSEGRHFRSGERVRFLAVPDKFLRPIRGSDGVDEIVRLVGKPEEVEA